MPRQSKATSPSSDPVSLIGDYAQVEPPAQGEELVVGKEPERPAAPEAPAPTVTVDKDGTITIR